VTIGTEPGAQAFEVDFLLEQTPAIGWKRTISRPTAITATVPPDCSPSLLGKAAGPQAGFSTYPEPTGAITAAGVANGSGDSSGSVVTTDDTDSVALAITSRTGATGAALPCTNYYSLSDLPVGDRADQQRQGLVQEVPVRSGISGEREAPGVFAVRAIAESPGLATRGAACAEPAPGRRRGPRCGVSRVSITSRRPAHGLT